MNPHSHELCLGRVSDRQACREEKFPRVQNLFGLKSRKLVEHNFFKTQGVQGGSARQPLKFDYCFDATLCRSGEAHSA